MAANAPPGGRRQRNGAYGALAFVVMALSFVGSVSLGVLAAPGTASAALCGGPPGAPVQNRGNGPVAGTPNVYVVLWGSGWTSGAQKTEADYVTSVFASLGGSSYQDNLAVYCVGPENGSSLLGGIWYDTTDPVQNPLPDAGAGAEAWTAAQANGWAADANNDVMLLLPPGVQIEHFNACAFHGRDSNLVYSVVPYASDGFTPNGGEAGGCDGYGIQATVRATVLASHEYGEAATDPYGTTFYDQNGNEIGDLCAPYFSYPNSLSQDSVLPGELAHLGGESVVQQLFVDTPGGGGCEGEATKGYWQAHMDGGVSDWGDAPALSCDSNSPCPSGGTVVDGMAAAPFSDAKGYYETDGAGAVFAFGSGAAYHGDLTGKHLSQPIRAIAVTPDGGGYWLVGGDGGIFTFGDAAYHGSCPAGGSGCQGITDVVAIAPTADGGGYWLVGSDGGVFTFGDARFYGSEAGINCAMTGISPTPEANALWLVDKCGDIFLLDGEYGPADSQQTGWARYFGTTSTTVGLGITGDLEGVGYYFWSSAGNIWNFASATWYGSDAACHCHTEVGFATTP